ncbi:MAG: excinuclease ABC subunit A, partial [Actinomyces sp.]|nr:excinuclease ABC subunit A [Actinomyces sp.]
AGTAHCPTCGAEITAQTPQQIVDSVRSMEEGTRFQVLAPVVRGRKGEYRELLDDLRAAGYSRALIDGEVVRLENAPTLEKKLKHTIEVVIDRLVVRDGMKQRLTDSVETALGLSEGLVVIDVVDLDADDPNRRRRYSEKRACPNDHPLALEDIEPRTFSFNAPYGACPECMGIGSRLEVDPDLVVPDEELSLEDGAVAPWSRNVKYHVRLLKSLGKELGFSTRTAWKELPSEARQAILYGKDYEVKVKFRNRWGRERSYTTGFEGAVNYIERKREETESDRTLERLEAYMREVPCPVCQGARLKPEVLAVRIGGLNVAEVSNLSIADLERFMSELELDQRQQFIARPILQEIIARLKFLNDVGLTYLTLSRAAGTLSGGEAQRIRLATQIGSGLVGVLYVLDEPSIGLHQRDNQRLIATLKRLRDLGNTLIVVEHDEETIESADWVVDIG